MLNYVMVFFSLYYDIDFNNKNISFAYLKLGRHFLWILLIVGFPNSLCCKWRL